jgi:pyruvate dehydrogenase E2 component (dihydrolipoamide acetyltransferase)
MVRPITMPKLGQSEEQATIVRWLKKEGDKVAKGDILFEIETDKALLEVESFYEGTVLKIVVAEGQTALVQSTVAFVGEPGEEVPTIPGPAAPAGRPEPKGMGPTAAPVLPRPLKESPLPREGSPAVKGFEIWRRERLSPEPLIAEPPAFLRISPRAAKLAKETVIDPSPLAGTGPGGRILERDVKAYLTASGYDQLRITPAAKELAAREGINILSVESTGDYGRITVDDVQRAVAERPTPLSRMRQAIAARLTQSYVSTPHFFVTVSVDLTELEALRLERRERGTTYTLTDFILNAAARSLVEFPAVNSTTDGKSVRWHSRVHLGLAVSLEQGLVVPVIRNADELTLAEIHDRASELSAKARAGKLAADEVGRSTFTISNMGMLDVENFTAIINPGESAILAVSSALKSPVVRDEQVAIRTMMKMTLSSDHRIVDGAVAARFLNAIKKKLEEVSLWRRLA